MNQPVLEFKNVTWTYEDMDHPALRDVSFTVDRGELVGIVGVNDAGKSTLCRLCNGKQPSFTDIFYITVHNKQHTTPNYRKTKHHD